MAGPEPLKISKGIDLRRQSVEYIWTRAVGQPKASTSHVLWAQPQQTLEKARFKMAWEGINYQTVSSKASPSTPSGAILIVKTPQACDKPAHWRHHAPGTGKHDVFEGLGAKTRTTHVLDGVQDGDTAARAAHLWGQGKATTWLKMYCFA